MKEKNKILLSEDELKLKEVEVLLEDIKKILQEQELENAYEFALWLKKKTELRYSNNIEHNFHILNNCIYWAYLGQNIGSEQDKHRPVLIVHTEKNSTVAAIIPLTNERLNDDLWYHVNLEEINSTALVEQLRVISKNRIDYPMRRSGRFATITHKDWTEINKELKRLYLLKPLTRPVKNNP